MHRFTLGRALASSHQHCIRYAGGRSICCILQQARPKARKRENDTRDGVATDPHNSLSAEIHPYPSCCSDDHHRQQDKNDRYLVPLLYNGQPQYQQRRFYHATPRHEIVPLLAVGAVVTMSYYSYRAWHRMKAEWDDYQYERHQYERWLAANDNENDTDETKMISLAIDLGTCFTKIASTGGGGPGRSTASASGTNKGDQQSIEVMITREGDRSFFNGIIYDGEDRITGRTALERYSFGGNNSGSSSTAVKLPFLSLASGDARQIFADVLHDPVKEVWERLLPLQQQEPKSSSGGDEGDDETTSASTAMTHRRRRIIVTVPTFFLKNPKVFEAAFEGLSSINDDDRATPSQTIFVPEPVATVWGAYTMMNRATSQQQQPNDSSSRNGRLPELAKADPVLVVDVGGWTTQISIVQNHRVLTGAVTLPWGGEVVVEHCARLLQQQAPADQQSGMTDVRAQALLQWHARRAVQELSQQTRVDVHIPYVFADPKRHHLDAQLARSVLEDVLDDHVSTHVDAASLSKSLPAPTDLKSWFTSAVARVLEDARLMPTNLKACLLVGGASRIPLVQRSLQSTLSLLLGPVFLDSIAVVPPFFQHPRSAGAAAFRSSFTAQHQQQHHPAEEWTVLGAATLAPSFGYSLRDGLVMNDKS